MEETSRSIKKLKLDHTFSEIPIKFTDDETSLEFRTFEKYLLLNKSAPINAKIVETETMKELFEKLLYEKRMFLALEGPPGSGKTTTLLWLYFQMKQIHNAICVPAFLTHESKDEVMKTIKTMHTDQPLYIFSDFCDVVQLSRQNLTCWTSIFCSRMHNHQIFVFALSSGFHLPRVLGSRSNQSLLNSLYAGFQKFTITQQANEIMVKIGLQFGVDTSSDALVKARGLPKLIILQDKALFDAYIKNELRILIRDGIVEDTVSLQDNLYFLIALRYQRSVTDFDLTIDDSENTVPCLANLVYLDSNGVPKPYIFISDNLMKYMIRLLKTKTGTVHVDEEAVVGYVFEQISSTIFEKPLSLQIGPRTAQIASMPLIPTKRIVAGDVLVKDTLYRCVKNQVAVDFVAITDIECTESLLLIQTSVQASNHLSKLEKVLKLKDINWKVDGKNTPPQKIVYLYLNPMATSNSYESRRLAFEGWINWQYAELAYSFRGLLQSLYTEARCNVL